MSQSEGGAAERQPGVALRAVGAEEDAALRQAVARARRIAEEQPEPYQSLAFTALLTHLLQERTVPAREPAPAESARPQQPPSTEGSIAEFLAQRRIDSHPERVLAIAYYHYHRHAGQGVTTKDLVEGYSRSRSKRPQNYPDVIASCIRKGYLVDGGRRDGMKTWVITASGEAHVEQDL